MHPSTGRRCWRFAWLDGDRWRYVTRKTQAEAEVAAGKVLEEQAEGLVWSTLAPARRRFLESVHRLCREEEEETFLMFLKSREKSGEIGAALVRFAQWKRAEAGEDTPWNKQVLSIAKRLGDHFTGRLVVDIQLSDLKDWWDQDSANKSAKTKRDLRAVLVAIWNWFKREGIAGNDAMTIAERIPLQKVSHGERRVLSSAEVLAILEEVRPEWRAWVVLGAFAGIRPEEICPMPNKKAAKRGLMRQEIDWNFNVIRVAGTVSKVGIPRVVPMSVACREWLLWAGITPDSIGPVCLSNPVRRKETLRLGAKLFGGEWPQDALRHSYGSYRNAVVRNLQQVAEEMGTSVIMLHRHYHNPQPEELGQEWFALRPSDPTRSDETNIVGE